MKKMKALRRDLRAGRKTEMNVRAEITSLREEMRNLVNWMGDVNSLRS